MVRPTQDLRISNIHNNFQEQGSIQRGVRGSIVSQKETTASTLMGEDEGSGFLLNIDNHQMTTWCRKPEDHILNFHHSANLKTHTMS